MSFRVLSTCRNTVLAFAVLALAAGLRAQDTTIPAAAQAALAQGKASEQHGELDRALDSYRTASKQAGNASPQIEEAIIRVQMSSNDFKAAIASATRLQKLMPDVKGRAQASMLLAQADFRAYLAAKLGVDGADKNPKRAADFLKDAEQACTSGLADDASNEPLRALHARTLAALDRGDEATREFTACAATPGTNPAECARALRLAHNLTSAREQPAPPFTATTLDGKSISLASLDGKVVLLDFWATWCTYCQRDSDYVQSMLDSFGPDKFVLLEVNVEDDHDKWANYVNDNRLEGTHIQDDHKHLQSAFNVTGFPTYIVLDANGTERFRASGTEGDLRGQIKKLIAEQTDIAPAAPTKHSGQ